MSVCTDDNLAGDRSQHGLGENLVVEGERGLEPSRGGT